VGVEGEDVIARREKELLPRRRPAIDRSRFKCQTVGDAGVVNGLMICNVVM
jgi:hypothetical protein